MYMYVQVREAESTPHWVQVAISRLSRPVVSPANIFKLPSVWRSMNIYMYIFLLMYYVETYNSLGYCVTGFLTHITALFDFVLCRPYCSPNSNVNYWPNACCFCSTNVLCWSYSRSHINVHHTATKHGTLRTAAARYGAINCASVFMCFCEHIVQFTVFCLLAAYRRACGSSQRSAATCRSPFLYSSREPSELSQWLCYDDSTINIVVVIIIIIIVMNSTSPNFDTVN